MEEFKSLTEEDLESFEKLLESFTLSIKDVKNLISEIRRLRQIINRAYEYALEEDKEPDLIMIEILKSISVRKNLNNDSEESYNNQKDMEDLT